jgi:hypothetical protein
MARTARIVRKKPGEKSSNGYWVYFPSGTALITENIMSGPVEFYLLKNLPIARN